MMLLVHHRNDPKSFRPRSGRGVDRLLAGVFAAALDQRLARGEPPEASRLLARRAQMLTAMTARRALARNWEQLLRLAEGEGSTRVPVQAGRIVAARPDIARMARALAAELPTPARGVAMARVLLVDGTGPLYNRHSSVDLGGAVRDATAQLDPSVPLAAPAVPQPGRLWAPGPS